MIKYTDILDYTKRNNKFYSWSKGTLGSVMKGYGMDKIGAEKTDAQEIDIKESDKERIGMERKNCMRHRKKWINILTNNEGCVGTEECCSETLGTDGGIADISGAGEIKESYNEADAAKLIVKRPPPFISYITFNRLGLTVRNLSHILESGEDFEMHIIDSNSKDDTWDYIQSLTDPRIKSKTKLPVNMGPIYAVNMGLAKRKPDQYFFTIDSDVFIKTPNWISKYMEVFDAFPEVGVLGIMRDYPYPRFMPQVIPRVKGSLSYLQLKNSEIDQIMDFIPGHLQCLRPELIDRIGFWSEENGYGDAELSPRIVHYTPFTAGFLTNVEIDMTQYIPCEECPAKAWCKLDGVIKNCFVLGAVHNKNESFASKFYWKYKETFKELAEGKRTAYCASVHSPESMAAHYYNDEWARENFEHYIKNSN